MSKRLARLDEIESQLKKILLINGFNTDVGKKITLGEVGSWSYTDDIPNITIIDDGESVVSDANGYTPTSVKIEQKIKITSYYKKLSNNGFQTLGMLIVDDVLKAILKESLENNIDIQYLDSLIGTDQIGEGFISVEINLLHFYTRNYCQ